MPEELVIAGLTEMPLLILWNQLSIPIPLIEHPTMKVGSSYH
jgi:hypothetical protein